MDFERGQEIKDAINLGRKENALPICSVDFISNEDIKRITDPYILKTFFKRFSDNTWINDPILGVQRIVLIRQETYINEETVMSGSGFRESYQTEVPIEVETPIDEWEGKTVLIDGDSMFEMPTVEKLENRDQGYFLACETIKREKDKIIAEAQVERVQMIMNSQLRRHEAEKKILEIEQQAQKEMIENQIEKIEKSKEKINKIFRGWTLKGVKRSKKQSE